MRVLGKFVLEKAAYGVGDAITVDLLVANQESEAVLVFLPGGRSDGVDVLVKSESSYKETSSLELADAGLAEGFRVEPGQSASKQYPLSQWLTIEGPGQFELRCSTTVEIRPLPPSLGDSSALAVTSELQFSVVS